MDNRRFKRLMYEVLDHDPKHDDIVGFFRRFYQALEAQGQKLLGITTDASALYPEPIAEVFGTVPHQLCEFHSIAELSKAVLKAVCTVLKRLKASLPPLPRGRPTAPMRWLALRKHRRQQQKFPTWTTTCFPPRPTLWNETRRHRKMQKSIYCVRTQANLQARIALDMQRDAQAHGRDQTLSTLHGTRKQSKK